MKILIPGALCAALLIGTGMASAAGMSNHSAHHGMSQQQASTSMGDMTDSHWTRRNDAGNPTTALNLLQEKGYTDFTNFHQTDGGKYAATVRDNGQTRNVVIDPATDSVQPES